MKKVTRECRKKLKHETTPICISRLDRWCTLQRKKECANEKSLGEESFKKIAQSQAVVDAVVNAVVNAEGETDDPFRFTSESSDEENDSDTFRCISESSDEENDAEAEDEFPSPENRRYRDSISERYHSAESLRRHFGSPKFTSSRIQDSIEDTNSICNPAKLGKRHFGSPKFASSRIQEIDKRRENFFDSNYQDLENECPQIPVQIDENYVKYRNWEEYINENIEDEEDKEYLEEIEIPLQEPALTFIRRSDQGNITKCSKQRKSLKPNKDISSGSQRQYSQDKLSTTVTNTESTEDDVFKNSNDTRSLMSKNVSDCICEETVLEEHSQTAKERSIIEVPDSSTARKKKPKEARGLVQPEISIRKKKAAGMRSKRKVSTSVKVIGKLKEERVIELEKELMSISVCPLSLTKTPFSRSKRLKD